MIRKMNSNLTNSFQYVTNADTEGFSAPSLKKNFLWTFFGNIVYAGCQWGMVVILAKLTNPESVGIFALAFAITAPIIMFANLQLRAVQATDAKDIYLFGEYLGLRIIMLLFALSVILGVILITVHKLDVALIILIVGIAKLFESLSDVFYGLLQRHERMDRIAKSMMIKGVFSLTALGAGVYFVHSVVWGVVGLAAAWGAVLLLYDIRSGALISKVSVFKILQPKWCILRLVKLMWLALPLGIVMALVSLNVNIPRYFVERVFGKSVLGIFAAVSYFMVSGNMVIMALGQSSIPRLSKYYDQGKLVKFKKLLYKLISIGVLIGLAGISLSIIFGRQILTLFYKPEYAKQENVFVLIMISAAISYIASFLGYGMTAVRYFKAQLPLLLVSVFSTVTLSFLFMKTYGFEGILFAMIISNLIQLIGSVYIISRAVVRAPNLNNK